MSSSFRRANPKTATPSSRLLKGTKPWAGGVTMTSVGLRELDVILGGGQPLGTTILLEQDRFAYDEALIQYWCAEGVCHEQVLLVPSFQEDDALILPNSLSLDEPKESSNLILQEGATPSQVRHLVDSLPRNLHWDKEDQKNQQQIYVDEHQQRPLQILEEEEDEEEKDDAEEGLKIAWQYRKSIQDQRLGMDSSSSKQKKRSSKEFCHSFDLSGRLNEQNYNQDCIRFTQTTSCCRATPSSYGKQCQKRTACGFQLFQELKQMLSDNLGTSRDTVVRLLLYRVPVEAMSIALPLLLAHIRSEGLPVVVFLTVRPAPHSSLDRLRRVSDVVLQADGFAARPHFPPPSEFRHLHGLLLLPKVSTVTGGGGGHFADYTHTKRPAAHVYGVKRDRRKLHISLLHIPPEDYAGSGSVSAGSVRSGAGRPKRKEESSGCGGGNNSLLDF